MNISLVWLLVNVAVVLVLVAAEAPDPFLLTTKAAAWPVSSGAGRFFRIGPKPALDVFLFWDVLIKRSGRPWAQPTATCHNAPRGRRVVTNYDNSLAA